MNTSETTKCTCPSGDGSLQWPCPTHNTEQDRQTWLRNIITLQQKVHKDIGIFFYPNEL